MTSAVKAYLRALESRFSYIGTWLPNGPLRLGDVGVHEGDEWKRITSLYDLGVPFSVRQGLQPVDFTYTSLSGLKVRNKLTAEFQAGGAPLAAGGLTIEFSEEGAFVFQATGCKVDEIEDQVALGAAVIRLFEQDRWKQEWSVVDTLVSSRSATIIVSNSSTSMLEIEARTPLQLANLADASAGISVTSQSGDVVRFIAAEGLTPLFKLSRMKRSLLDRLLGRKPITFGGVEPVDAAPSEVAPEDAFERVVLDS